MRIPEKGNLAADPLARFTLKVTGGGTFPDRELKGRPRRKVQAVCGKMDVDCMDRTHGALRIGGPLPEGRLCWLPGLEMVELALDRLRRSRGDGWLGGEFLLVPVAPRSRCRWKLRFFEKAVHFPCDASLFAHRPNCRPELVPTQDTLAWVAIKLRVCA